VFNVFSIRNSGGAQADGLAEDALERRRLPVGGPELELGVPHRTQFNQELLAAIVQFDSGHDLRMAAVERLGESQHRRERPHRLLLLAAERAPAGLRFFRCRLAVVSRDQCDDLRLLRLEPA
jgi:hypothetical protein